MNTLKIFLLKQRVQYLLLTVMLLIIAIYYDYFGLMSVAPTGTHIWRQTDSASFAWCYWQNGLDFFHPQMMNRVFGDGYALSEFPILQYFIGILYTLFGFKWVFSKAVYVAVYLGGIYAIYYITSFFIKDIFWSFFLALIFFAAPTLAFYGNSCVPDVAALSLSFIGFAFYLSHKKNNSKYFLWCSTIMFCLAGLLKVTYLITFVALFLSEASTVFCCNNQEDKQAVKKYWIPLLFMFILIVAWMFYMKFYNNINHQSYFLTKINPYWNPEVDNNTKSYIFKRTYTEWADRFFHSSTHLIFFLSLVSLPFTILKSNRFIFKMIVFLLIGSILYYILWYIQFYVHDYYTIPFYSIYFFTIFSGCFWIHKLELKGFKNYSIKIAAILLLIFNVQHTKKDFKIRFDEAAIYSLNRVLEGDNLANYIRTLGILPKDYIVSIPDDSPQISLCILGNPGFTEFGVGHYDIKILNEKKQNGAKYMILLDKTAYKDIAEQLGKPFGVYKDVFIYKL